MPWYNVLVWPHDPSSVEVPLNQEVPVAWCCWKHYTCMTTISRVHSCVCAGLAGLMRLCIHYITYLDSVWYQISTFFNTVEALHPVSQTRMCIVWKCRYLQRVPNCDGVKHSLVHCLPSLILQYHNKEYYFGLWVSIEFGNLKFCQITMMEIAGLKKIKNFSSQTYLLGDHTGVTIYTCTQGCWRATVAAGHMRCQCSRKPSKIMRERLQSLILLFVEVFHWDWLKAEKGINSWHLRPQLTETRLYGKVKATYWTTG